MHYYFVKTLNLSSWYSELEALGLGFAHVLFLNY